MLRTLIPCQDMSTSSSNSNTVVTHRSGTTTSSGKPVRPSPQYDPPQSRRPPSAPAPRSSSSHRSRAAENVLADPRSETPEHEEDQAAPERSKHDASTASYMWPRFEPKSAKSPPSPPLLYVDYRDYPRPAATVPPGRAAISGISTPPASRSPVNPSPSSRSYTSLSSVTAASTSRDRGAYSPRLAHSAAVRQPSGEHVPLYRGSPPADRELQTTLRKLDINAHGAKLRRAGGSPPWHPYSSESESSCGPSPTAYANASGHGTTEPDTEEWMRYARAVESSGSAATYTCLWPESRDGRTFSCGYSSKKHLVKRHVESKHLQIKPIICEVCGKGFSQRTNYSTHMNTHTGAAPHKCQYPGCGATFGDPARRHRHMKAVHNHVPSKRRTQSESGSMHLDIDMSDPEGEDSN